MFFVRRLSNYQSPSGIQTRRICQAPREEINQIIGISLYCQILEFEVFLAHCRFQGGKNIKQISSKWILYQVIQRLHKCLSRSAECFGHQNIVAKKKLNSYFNLSRAGINLLEKCAKQAQCSVNCKRLFDSNNNE